MISPPVRGKSWVVQVTLLCVILGALLGLTLKSKQHGNQEGYFSRTGAGVNAMVGIVRAENIQLTKELNQYKEKYEKIAKKVAEGTRGSEGLEDALLEAKIFAGLVKLQGPGVVVTLKDSPKWDPKQSQFDEVAEKLIVHDYDIRSVVNELFGAGAEAVCVNDERLVSTSVIRCAGTSIFVNSARVAPPIVIKAIGMADQLESAMNMPGGVADQFVGLGMFELKKYPELVVPAYKGITMFKVAKPVGETARKEAN